MHHKGLGGVASGTTAAGLLFVRPAEPRNCLAAEMACFANVHHDAHL